MVVVDVLDTSETASKIRALNRRVCQVQANLMERAIAQKVVDRVVSEMGIDILLNNAGIIHGGCWSFPRRTGTRSLKSTRIWSFS